jgi:hypothetical protein
MKRKNTLIAILAILSLSGCDSTPFKSEAAQKEEWLSQFRTLVNVTENREVVSPEEWRDFDREYNSLSDVIYKKYERILSKSEFDEVADLRDRYKSRRFRSKAATTVKESYKNVMQFFKELTH